jgi:aryl-alcohol dehydrogenase-like predicted oxidoreductase
MKYRPLGSTGLQVSEISFGAGPVSALMTGSDQDRQRAVVARAIEQGINWFDTAAGYGNGQSEASLGAALATLPLPQPVHVATKVRLQLDQETDLRQLVVASVRASLQRLQLPRITLLQLHNSITPRRDDEPTSLTPEDVLGPHGVLAALQDLRAEGLVQHFGLTGLGDPQSLCEVIHSRQFATVQAPFHLLNPSALVNVPSGSCQPDYRGFLQAAYGTSMGIFAIRVFAAGALLGAAPSAHTQRTPFFPLALYERDLSRAGKLAASLGGFSSLQDVALRYVLSRPEIASAIVGFGDPAHVDAAEQISQRGPLTDVEASTLQRLLERQ